jgi:hypothetical protein
MLHVMKQREYALVRMYVCVHECVPITRDGLVFRVSVQTRSCHMHASVKHMLEACRRFITDQNKRKRFR